MKFQEYLNYADSFSGKADDFFKRKFSLDERSDVTAEQAFFQIETLGKKPKLQIKAADLLLQALKGKSAYNFRIRQLSDEIKLAHKEKYVWILAKNPTDTLVVIDFDVYKDILFNLLSPDSDRHVFDIAWKQARIK